MLTCGVSAHGRQSGLLRLVERLQGEGMSTKLGGLVALDIKDLVLQLDNDGEWFLTDEARNRRQKEKERRNEAKQKDMCGQRKKKKEAIKGQKHAHRHSSSDSSHVRLHRTRCSVKSGNRDSSSDSSSPKSGMGSAPGGSTHPIEGKPRLN